MKFRTDYVTNSSSTSYIVARKPELTDKQKEAFIQFVEKYFFRNPELKPGASDKDIMNIVEDWGLDDENEGIFDKIKTLLNEGYCIYFESEEVNTGEEIINMQYSILDVLKKDNSSVILEERLDY